MNRGLLECAQPKNQQQHRPKLSQPSFPSEMATKHCIALRVCEHLFVCEGCYENKCRPLGKDSTAKNVKGFVSKSHALQLANESTGLLRIYLFGDRNL